MNSSNSTFTICGIGHHLVSFTARLHLTFHIWNTPTALADLSYSLWGSVDAEDLGGHFAVLSKEGSAWVL